jgi:hypothetical protein
MTFNETIKVRLADGSVVEAKASKRENTCLAIVDGHFRRVHRALAIVNGRFRRVHRAARKKIYTLAS